MNPTLPLFTASLLLAGQGLQANASWPQWRGPERNGVSLAKTTLADSWPEDGPKLLWESEPAPSGDDGGFGSLVAADGKAYLSVVWHRNVPTETRAVNSLTLRKLGARRANLPQALIDKMETARLSLSPRLRGTKLNDWAARWVDDHLDAKQKLLYGDYVVSRFRQGKLAFPIDAANKLFSISKETFPNEKALLARLSEFSFDEALVQRILDAVPHTKKVAEDVILALDLENGTTLWKAALPGIPSGRNSSATPCVSDGKIYALGSNRLFCVDAHTGKPVWDSPVSAQGGASSVLVDDDKVFALVDRLSAFDASTGKLLWENQDATGKTASPALWTPLGKKEIVCNSKRSVVGVSPQTGETLWEAPAGGSSTPTPAGEFLVTHAKDEKVGIAAYRRTKDGVEPVWSHPKITRRTDSSPIVYEGRVYLFGAGMRLCLDLKTGKQLAKVPAKHDISSPILADGKIFTFSINASFLDMVRADPNEFIELGHAKVRALRCSSPSIVGNKLLVRLPDRIACYDLGK